MPDDLNSAPPHHQETDANRDQTRGHMPDRLRADVRMLGDLLGRILSEAGGPDLLNDVESLRALVIRAQAKPDSAALHEAEALVDSFSSARAEEVARAFSCYFHLVNLAEEHHRVRVLRQRESALDAPVAHAQDSLPMALRRLEAELGANEARARLARLEFRPVLTAHPTEARRRAIAGSIRRITTLLAARDDALLGGVSLLENTEQLLAEIDGLWRTSPLRMTKPSPLDEVRTAMGVFDETLFSTLPEVYRRLDTWVNRDALGTAAPVATSFVRLGTWIGGDRDGNPNVTAQITRTAAAIASEHVLIALENVADRVGRTMTLDATTTPASPALDQLWLSQRQLAPDLTADIATRSPNEPHRRAILVVAARLKATRMRDADLAYPTAADLLTDLRTVQESLVAAGARRVAYSDLQKFIWQVETFGFHLAEIEIRQHSQVHRETLADIAEHGADGPGLSERSIEVLDTFRAMAAIQKRHGVEAARRYVVSFTQCAADLANVYSLAEYALGVGDTSPVLDVVPLFETFADLQDATRILTEIIDHPQVVARLGQTDRRFEVMLGYSDSSKDVGPVSATLALYEAQSRIAEWARDNNITLTLFHGRGGALGRGGGPANRAVLAQPPASVDGRFKLTEQGEVIAARYGDPDIAIQHIEQVAAATLLQSTPSVGTYNAQAAERFAPIAETLDQVSRARFFELVHAEGFPAWFAQVTPQEEIGLLPLGSRPAKRGLSVNSLDDLRAIPWVFAWTQARINLTGWFGLGSALAAIGDVELLQRAHAEWPLFSTMIDNVAMSLAKTDERIAKRYLSLGDRDDLAALVLDEMALTTEWVLKITGNDRVLSELRVLGRAVQLRSPYVDALSLIQLRALRALRRGAPAEQVPQLQRLLLLSVNGIAAGLQNTG